MRRSRNFLFGELGDLLVQRLELSVLLLVHPPERPAETAAHRTAFDAGSIADSWRQQPGAPAYCTDLTAAEMGAALAAAERSRLQKRRDLALAAIMERFGGGGKNPDADYGVRLNRALFM